MTRKTYCGNLLWQSSQTLLVGFKDKQERPLNFHWTTTVALDGTVTNTPMVIEQPQ